MVRAGENDVKLGRARLEEIYPAARGFIPLFAGDRGAGSATLEQERTSADQEIVRTVNPRPARAGAVEVVARRGLGGRDRVDRASGRRRGPGEGRNPGRFG